MRIDPRHPFARSVWWSLVVLNLVFAALLLVVAVAKPFTVVDAERAFSVDPSYSERIVDQMGPSLFTSVAKQFDLDAEMSFANWVSTLQFAFCGLLAFIVYSSLPRKRTPVAAGWLLAGTGMLFLSIEEATGFHEIVGVSLGGPETVSVGPLSWHMVYRWVLIYSIPLLLAAVLLILWVRKAMPEEPRLRRLVFLGVAFWIVALLLEGIGTSIPHAFTRVEIFFEELSEMVGALLFIYSFAHFQSRMTGSPLTH